MPIAATGQPVENGFGLTSHQQQMQVISVPDVLKRFFVVLTVVSVSLSAESEQVENYNNQEVLEWARVTDSHPLGGFWKKSCQESFGLAIGPWNEEYFVTFCGEAGCVPPNMYRESTPIYGDSNYEVHGLDAIDVVGNQGQISRYIRCQKNAIDADLMPK